MRAGSNCRSSTTQEPRLHAVSTPPPLPPVTVPPLPPVTKYFMLACTAVFCAQLLLGRFAAAAASFRQALSLLPESPAAVLNLADAEWLGGRKGEAEILYRKVLDLADRDPAPTFWQTRTIRAQALAHLGRRDDAVAAVQLALRDAPDNPQVAYEASLVHALVGDAASARVHAARAREAGYDRRWFSFPWFEGIELPPESGSPRPGD